MDALERGRMMEQTFTITITSYENHTWQGVLYAQGAGCPFRSEMELLLELARRLHPETCGLSFNGSDQHLSGELKKEELR